MYYNKLEMTAPELDTYLLIWFTVKIKPVG